MKVGDIVKPINPQLHPLRSGCGWYSVACVVQMNPFTIMSEEGDMMWQTTIKAENFETIGRASPIAIENCRNRMSGGLPDMLKQFDEIIGYIQPVDIAELDKILEGIGINDEWQLEHIKRTAMSRFNIKKSKRAHLGLIIDDVFQQLRELGEEQK